MLISKSVLAILTTDRICNTEMFTSLCLFIDTNIAQTQQKKQQQRSYILIKQECTSN